MRRTLANLWTHNLILKAHPTNLCKLQNWSWFTLGGFVLLPSKMPLTSTAQDCSQMQVPKLSLLGQCCSSFCCGLWGDDALIMPSVRSLSIAERCAHIWKDQVVLYRHQRFRSLVLTDCLARCFQIAFLMITSVFMDLPSQGWV